MRSSISEPITWPKEPPTWVKSDYDVLKPNLGFPTI